MFQNLKKEEKGTIDNTQIKFSFRRSNFFFIRFSQSEFILIQFRSLNRICALINYLMYKKIASDGCIGKTWNALFLCLPFLSLPSSYSKYLEPPIEHRRMYINDEYRSVTYSEMTYRHLECRRAHIYTPTRVYIQFRWLSHQPVIYSNLMRPDMFDKHERGAKKGQCCSSDVCRRL